MYLNEMQEQVRDMARAFADDVIRPVAEALDRDERFPVELYDEMAKLGPLRHRRARRLGRSGVRHADLCRRDGRTFARLCQRGRPVRSRRTDLDRFWCATAPRRRKSCCRRFCRCAPKVAYCITEPEAGTDVSGIRTTATPDGDGWHAERRQDLDPQCACCGLRVSSSPAPTRRRATAACRSSLSICMPRVLNAAPRNTRWASAPVRSGR